MLKNVDKKLLFLAGLLIFLPIFTILLLATLQSCSNSGNSYEKYEKLMHKSAERYLKKNKLIPKNSSEVFVVKLNTLVTKEYIKSPEDELGDASCTGSVKVRRNGLIESKETEGYLNYTVNLNCKNYKTKTLKDILLSQEIQNKSGLYLVDNQYIFKGDRPKNYINFYGKDYRIMGITEKGYIKLIRSEAEPISRSWDNKYNIDAQKAYGKNIYGDSLILRYLIEDYSNPKKINKQAKQHIVSNDVCIGKRSVNDINIDKAADCSEILSNQVVSMLTMSDYALASNDPDCLNLKSRSCSNYNYLYNVASSTWTSNVVTDNSYDVFYVGDGIINSISANKYNSYNIVIYIDGDETITNGSGSLDDPYVIK